MLQRRWVGLVFLMLLALPAVAQERDTPDEAQILAGAKARIERYRKADAVVRVVDRRGRPVRGATVRVEQVRHAFLFGCNAFPLLGDSDPKREALFEKRFTDLLNYATLGFYWSAYEPQPGQTAQARLERQARWLKARGIAVKGHPLVWHETYPAWAPSDPDETKSRLKTRVTDIVSHFAGLIDRWDVVNEANASDRFDNGVGHWAKRDGAAAMVETALGWAHAANPKATSVYNDYDVSQRNEALVGVLLKDHAPVDVIGIQSHMHNGEWPIPRVWQVCETFARFGKPLHFTETTVLSGEHGWMRPAPWPSTPEGEAHQADYVEKLYTTLFSHPAVQAITWWDLMDGGWQGAPAGLVRADLSPKPAYDRLMKLIHHDWWTSERIKTDRSGAARFRGFLGHYCITVTTPKGTVSKEMDVRKGAPNALQIPLP